MSPEIPDSDEQPGGQKIEDIPEVKIIGNEIEFVSKRYPLISNYLCPICSKPIISMWALDGEEDRIPSNVIGRSLRDSGFGGYRFFQSKSGQGFEYDTEKDPRKRHQHSKQKQYSWGRDIKYEYLWIPFIQLNPIFSMNEFLTRTLDPHGDQFGKNHQFITNQALALKIIKKMEGLPDIFKITKDTMKHGKPLFYFDLVKWEDNWQSRGGIADRLSILKEWFGEDLVNRIDVVSKIVVSEEERGYYGNPEENPKKEKRDFGGPKDNLPPGAGEPPEYEEGSNPRYQPGIKYNVAGYVFEEWHWGNAIKRKDGLWDFVLDHQTDIHTIKPRHIRVYGKLIDH